MNIDLMRLKIRALRSEPCSPTESGILDLIEGLIDDVEESHKDKTYDPEAGNQGHPYE